MYVNRGKCTGTDPDRLAGGHRLRQFLDVFDIFCTRHCCLMMPLSLDIFESRQMFRLVCFFFFPAFSASVL